MKSIPLSDLIFILRCPLTDRLNISDIAEKAGVSRTTVSRVLNNKSNVDERTREKVLKVIEEVGYVPSSVARNLRQRRTNKIGLLLYAYVSGVHVPGMHIASEYYFEIIRGITLVAETADYNIILYSSLSSEGTLDNLNKICGSGEVDGLILVGTGQMQPVIDVLKNNKMPFVVANRLIEDPNVSFVGPDDEEGAYKATRHLIELGHERIAYLARPDDEETNKNRLNGYKRALSEANILFTEDLVESASYEWGSGERAIQSLIQKGNPSAVFAFNDTLAIDTVHACAEIGLRIPQDLAIIGFDDIHSSAVIEPSLSTIHQPLFEIGFKAMKILFTLIQDQDSRPVQIIVPLEVIKRQSTIG